MRKKRYIFLLLTGAFFFGCQGQGKKSVEPVASQHSDKDTPRLTTANYVETIMGAMQDYSRQPLYYVFVHNDMCTYQLLVNDMLEYQYSSFEYQKLASPINLNPDILRSGKQTLTYRLYPIGDQAVFEPRNEFGYDTSLKLNIYKEDGLLGLVSEELVLSHSAKIEKDGKMVFPGVGKDYYEYTITFDAEVPYNHKGWTEGQNLKELDQKTLEKEVLLFFERQWQIFKDRDLDAWYSYLYQKEIEVTQSLYNDREDVEDRLKENQEDLSIKNYRIHELKDYSMEFFGNNRVVSLLQTNKDPFFRGQSAIFVEDVNDVGSTEVVIFRDIYIYLPKGKELKAENFVIIR